MAAPLPQPPPAPEEWLAAYARVQRLADREILALLKQAQTDIQKMLHELVLRPGIGAAVRREQLRIIQRNMLRIEAVVFRKLGDIVQLRRVEAAERAIALSGKVDQVLFNAAGEAETGRALARGATLGLQQSVEVAVARMTGVAVPLSQRIYKTQLWVDGRLQAKINSALARGLSAREFAAEAVDWISPLTPGGVRYAAMRLARTEINNAFHAISIRHSQEAPWVNGMKWQLSRSHPRSDNCDSLAHDDPDRLGEGVYKPFNVPSKPHPQCLCFVTPVVVDEDEFIDNLVAGKYDHAIERGTSNIIPTAPPLKVVPPPKKAKPKPTKTPEQLAEEKLKRRAKTHAGKIADMPAGVRGQRDMVVGELQKQSAVTPNSMLKLQKVQADEKFTPYSNHWDKTQASNTGAVYQYTGPNREIHLSPRIFSDFDGYQRDFGAGPPWHVPSDKNGLESVVAHEYGHHLDSMITNHKGTWEKTQADAFFPTLSRELGITTQPKRDFFNRVPWQNFDKWVEDNSQQIERMVSTYGATNGREILAEIWSEFSTRKRPRTHITNIGRLLKQLAEEASK